VNAVEVVRGGVVESRHRVSVVVCDEHGVTAAAIGEADAMTFFRSAAKPMQALPLVEEGVHERLGLSAEEVALCCASHEGEERHIDTARSILAKAGVDESLLRCGAHAPFSEEAAHRLATAGEKPRRIHNNCSGKHAGMLALAVAMGWDPTDYHRADHPVQRRMLREIARWSDRDESEIPVAVDGCGIPCFAVPLHVMAAGFARYAASAHRGEAAGTVVDAMTGHPFMVGGTGRTCTDVMDVAGDRVFVKLGAEGVYGGGLPSRSLGFALKVADGGRRAVEVALIRTLECVGVLSANEVASLSRHGNPDVTNTRGEVVGELRAAFDLPLVAAATGADDVR
jgi:L-asparaginase II